MKKNLPNLEASLSGKDPAIESPVSKVEAKQEPDNEMSFNVDTSTPVQLKSCPNCPFVSKSEKRIANHVRIKHSKQDVEQDVDKVLML